MCLNLIIKDYENWGLGIGILGPIPNPHFLLMIIKIIKLYTYFNN